MQLERPSHSTCVVASGQTSNVRTTSYKYIVNENFVQPDDVLRALHLPYSRDVKHQAELTACRMWPESVDSCVVENQFYFKTTYRWHR